MLNHESSAVWLGHLSLSFAQLLTKPLGSAIRQLVAVAQGQTSASVDGPVASGVIDGADTMAQALEPDGTRQTITFLVVCLIVIAVLLALLTAWYWQFTSPKRRSRALLTDLGHYETGSIVIASAGPDPEAVESPPPAVVGHGPRPALVPIQTAGASGPLPVERLPAAKHFETKPDNSSSSSSSSPPRPTSSPPPSPAPPAEPKQPNRTRVPAIAVPGMPDRPKKPPITPITPATPATRSTETATPDTPSAPGVTGSPTNEKQQPRRIEVAARGVDSATSAPPARPTAAQPDPIAAAPANAPTAGKVVSSEVAEGLSDDEWAAVMQSAFDRLKQ